MKNDFATVVLCIAITTCSSAVLAESYYFKGGSSIGFPYQQGEGYVPNQAYDFDNGHGFHLTVGKDFSEAFSGEVELSHQSYDIEGIANLISGNVSPSKKGDLIYTSLILNAIYRPFSSSNNTYLKPYFGAGIGMTKVEWSDVEFAYGGPGSTIDDFDTVGAGQIFIGNRFNLQNNWVVDLEYRYFKTEDYNLYTSDGYPGRPTDSAVNSLLLSIGKKF